MSSRLESIVCLLIAALVGFSACSPAQRDKPGKPEVLLVTVDGLRADHLAAYGYHRDPTPGITALAERAVVFEDCLTPISHEMTALSALMVGAHPLETGLVAPERPLPDRFTRFAEILDVNDYRTHAATSTSAQAVGLAYGFQSASWPESPEAERPDEVTAQRALDWWEDPHEGGARFSWVHLTGPARRLSVVRMESSLDDDAPARSFLGQRWSVDGVVEVGGEPASAYVASSAYDALIRSADRQITRLVEAVGDESMVILASTGGRSLGEEGRSGRGGLAREQLQVPCMIRSASLPPRRVESPVALSDLLVTALGLIGAEGIELFADQGWGQDPWGDGYEERAVISIRGAGQNPGAAALHTAEWRLVAAQATPELYDRKQDPHSTRNLAAEKPGVTARLLEAVVKQKSALSLGIDDVVKPTTSRRRRKTK